jgi:hypothetical protein
MRQSTSVHPHGSNTSLAVVAVNSRTGVDKAALGHGCSLWRTLTLEIVCRTKAWDYIVGFLAR